MPQTASRGHVSTGVLAASYTPRLSSGLERTTVISVRTERTATARRNIAVTTDFMYHVSDSRNINALEIKRRKSNKVVYKLGQTESQPEEQESNLVTEAHINTLFFELQRTGVGKPRILKNYQLNDIHEMNIEQFRDAMNVLKKKPDKPTTPDPETIPPDDPESGLPWN